MIVRLNRQSSRHRDLSTRQPYMVIGIEADHFRILNDAGRPYLYPPRLFVVTDRHEPGDWVMKFRPPDIAPTESVRFLAQPGCPTT